MFVPLPQGKLALESRTRLSPYSWSMRQGIGLGQSVRVCHTNLEKKKHRHPNVIPVIRNCSNRYRKHQRHFTVKMLFGFLSFLQLDRLIRVRTSLSKLKFGKMNHETERKEPDRKQCRDLISYLFWGMREVNEAAILSTITWLYNYLASGYNEIWGTILVAPLTQH